MTEPVISPSSPQPPLARYLAPIILGMDDALVELTGALAGFTIALENNRLIALAGLTTGIAATLSMAASEFLSQKAARQPHNAWKAAILCGLSYFITVSILLAPFFLLKKSASALSLSLFLAAILIFIFTIIVSYVRKTSFKHNFMRMLFISFGVALISFLLTWSVQLFWGVEI